MSDHAIRTSSERALLAERIKKLSEALADGVYEREDTMRLCLLAALAGESVFLLGPPGIAKSFIAKRLINAFDHSRYFEYLMTRFSTPEEVFGPLSIQELKDNGKYVRLTDGYLPDAQVVFLDEIWKAGPAILNTLLTVVNEKTFKNGNDILPVPMRLLISASNELPDADSGLDALYDRMLVRIFVNRIEDKNNFRSMLTTGTSQETTIDSHLVVTDEEYYQWQNEFNQLTLSDTVFDKLYELKTLLESIEQDTDEPLYISDRRWKNSVKLLKACAFFSGRDEINPMDLLLLQDCLWTTPKNREEVRHTIKMFAVEKVFDQQQIALNIELLSETSQKIETIIQDKQAIQFHANAGTHRLMKKDQLGFDFSMGKRYSVGNSSQMIKLILLQENESVSEEEKGDSRWVYVNPDEMMKQMKEGKAEVYGYVNQNPKLVMLRFELDAEAKLVIRDNSNRAVLVGMVGHNDPTEKQYSDWREQLENHRKLLEETDNLLLASRAQFHAALPHPFIDNSLPLDIEKSVYLLAQKLEEYKRLFESMSKRILKFNDYYS